MKQIIFIICILLLSTFTAADLQKDFEKEMSSLIGSELPGLTKNLFDEERINIYITSQEGKVIVVGIATANGKIGVVSADQLENPTLNVYTTEKVFRRILASKNPLAAFRQSFENVDITYSVVGFLGKIKFGIASFFLGIFDWFSEEIDEGEVVKEVVPEISEEELPAFAIENENLEIAEITSCGNPENGWQENVHYMLINNLDSDFKETCFIITSSNMVLDGNGFILQGDGGIGIRVEDQSGIIIKGFSEIRNYATAISLEDVSETRITGEEFSNTRLIDNEMGLEMVDSNNNLVDRLSFESSFNDYQNDGIGLSGLIGSGQSNENAIRNNYFRGLDSAAESIGGLNNTFINNNLIDNKKGMYFHESVDEIIEGNRIETVRKYGIQVSIGSGTKIIGNSVEDLNLENESGGNYLAVIYLKDAIDFAIERNSLRNNDLNGIQFVDSSQGLIRRNIIIRHDSGTGIYLDNSPAIRMVGNTVENNLMGIAGAPHSASAEASFEDNFVCHNFQFDINCEGLVSVYTDGLGNRFTTLNACPVQGYDNQNQWPIEANYEPCG